jgi:ADP-heptose:LPS heptosyltransferase
MTRVLAVRLDNDGDVLVTGPAIRALAASASHLTLLHGPRGRHAAALLPGPDRLTEWCAPWIDPDPGPVTVEATAELIGLASGADVAVIFTSFHQSPLPLALLFRLAGVPFLAAISDDYPGSLLDVRHRAEYGIPEPQRALSLAAAAGFALPPGDDGRLRIRTPLPDVPALTGPGPYVVVHPGTSVPARAWPAFRHAEAVAALTAAGHRILVTGGPAERELTAQVAGNTARDLGGRTTLAELAAVLAGASAVVVGNTGPAHLAAAVGAPIVSLFAPTVPASAWAPAGATVLGGQHAACAGTRATVCPVPGHPCLTDVSAADVVAAVGVLTAQRGTSGPLPARGVSGPRPEPGVSGLRPERGVSGLRAERGMSAASARSAP